MRIGRTCMLFAIAASCSIISLVAGRELNENEADNANSIPSIEDPNNDAEEEASDMSYAAGTTGTISDAASDVCKKDVLSEDNLLQGGSLINGTHISLLLALPLTFEESPLLHPAFFQLASAMMAVDHFNERNSDVVPELEQIKQEDCRIQIDYESLRVMDTGVIEKNALKTILDQVRVPRTAIVGPYNELPALELSIVASALEIPMVSHRALDHNLLLPKKHPMVTQVNPDLFSEMEFLGDYLIHTGRTNYIAVLYASSADSAIQRLEAFRGVAKKLKIPDVKAFPYVSPAIPVTPTIPEQTIQDAVQKVAESGYRTIVWITPYQAQDQDAIGAAAHEYQLDRGDHLWIIGASLELETPLSSVDGDPNVTAAWEGLYNVTMTGPLEIIAEMIRNETTAKAAFENNPYGTQFLLNSAVLKAAELLDETTWDDSPFMKAWVQLDSTTFVERMQQLNPVPMKEYQKEWKRLAFLSYVMGWIPKDDEDDPSKILRTAFPPKDLFSNPMNFLTAPSFGSLTLYDAVIAVGLGACRAHAAAVANKKNSSQTTTTATLNDNLNEIITGEMLQNGIRAVDFQGATGQIRFGNVGFPGSRDGSSVTHAVYNLFPNRNYEVLNRMTEYRNATDGKWYTIHPFVYADKSTNPPKLLRNEGNPNYLSNELRIVGLALAGVALFVVVASLIWLGVYRHHRVVVASQPMFLVGMCVAVTCDIAAMLLLGLDEGAGWSQEALDHVCLAIPWLTTLGHIALYNMLFTKLWRVNRVLQFSRRKVTIKHVIWPALLIEAAAFIILSIWTATTNYGWDRHVIDVATGETMGQCGDNAEQIGFWIPIIILALIPTVATGIMAWKTIDVDGAYSEAKWIFALILVQCQVMLVGVPLIIILEDVSTNGRYLGTLLMLWTFPMTTMGLIIVPKMVAVHFPGGPRDTRGSSGGVRVTGHTDSSADKSP